MGPICELATSIQRQEEEKAFQLIEKTKIVLTQEEKKLKGKELNRVVLGRWLPAADCLLETIITKLPSPKEAQQYRTPYLY